MINFIDNFLNRITMYRLMLYYLTVLIVAAIIFCLQGILPYSAKDLIYSVAILLVSCLLTNKIFSKFFGISTNIESDYITALILALIITPGSSLTFLVLAGVFSQASKYILNFRGKHIFNPAAIAVVATLLVLQQGASWWVGNIYILPIVIVGGLLVARKIQRFDLIISFLVVYLATSSFYNRSGEIGLILKTSLMNSALLYITFVMLTEPLTSPTTRKLRIIYGAIIGFMFGYTFIIGPLYSSPELALVLGNIFSFAVSVKGRLKLTFISKTEAAMDIYDFVFAPNRKLNFQPGQYLEWTLPTAKADSRGNRRYFTIASSPTEDNLRLGVRFYDKPSSFKKSLVSLNAGDKVWAGQLSGDFVLPQGKSKKLVFMAGGIGITPFRSMLKYLLDNYEQRSITLFYSDRSEDKMVYKDVLNQAEDRLGVKIVFVATEKSDRLSAQTIASNVPDYKDRLFYLSGSRAVVLGFEKAVKALGVPGSQIKKDFFPGYA